MNDTNETLQINALNTDEILKLRKSELTPNKFKLNHLDDTFKQKMLNLLMKNYKVFSISYKTLGCKEEIVPDFKLLHNYDLQTKPYPIPKIAN